MSAVERTSRSPYWVTALVVGIAGLFYAYAVWNAISHLITMAQNGLSGTGWAVLCFGVVFPAIGFAFAFAIGRRRALGELTAVLLAGLGVVAVFWMSLLAYSLTLLGT